MYGEVCSPTERRILRPVEPTPDERVPVAPRHTPGGRGRIVLHRRAYEAYQRMKAAAEADGIPANLLTIVSGYRSVAHQTAIWERALRKYGSREEARKWVAPPGGSPHHSGRAVDLALGVSNSSENVEALRRTAAWRWLSCNAGRFGFTPYLREPWHWEYNPPDFAPAPRPAPTSPPPTPRRVPTVATPKQRRRPPVRPAPRAAAPPTPDLPGFTPSEMRALRITTTWETGKPLKYDTLSGDFDGMGISLGLLQWNIGAGSLQPLIREFITRAPDAVNAIFGLQAGVFRAMMAQAPRERAADKTARIARQLAFFRGLCDTSVASKPVKEPWATFLRRMADHPVFREIQVRAVRRRMDGAVREARDLGFRTERGLVFLFDTQTQAGGAWRRVGSRQRLIDERRAARQRTLGRPLTERETMEVMANVVADTSSARWKEKVRTRRMTIVTGRGRVHGTDYDSKRDYGVTDRPWSPAP